jgi:hypothetical protein
MTKVISYEKQDWKKAIDFVVIFTLCMSASMSGVIIFKAIGICFGTYMGYNFDKYFPSKLTKVIKYLEVHGYKETTLRTKDTQVIVYENRGSYFKARTEEDCFKIIKVDDVELA